MTKPILHKANKGEWTFFSRCCRSWSVALVFLITTEQIRRTLALFRTGRPFVKGMFSLEFLRRTFHDTTVVLPFSFCDKSTDKNGESAGNWYINQINIPPRNYNLKKVGRSWNTLRTYFRKQASVQKYLSNQLIVRN